MAWGNDLPSQPGGDSALQLLAAVGDGAAVAPSEEAAASGADSALTSGPVAIDHSQHTVSTFLDSGTVASADQILMLANRAFDVIVTLGGGFDSNPRLENGADGEWVTWADMRFLLNPNAFGSDSRGLYYGFDVGSSVFSYGSDSARAGRDQGELDVSAFTGVRGAKTDVRFDLGYQMNNGNLIDFSDLDREARRSDSDDLSLRLSAMRRFDHSELSGALDWQERNFNSDSGLNDVTSTIGDVGWLFSPAAAPKTDVGAGLRVGSYDSDRNFQQEFFEPSLRFIHRFSPKTLMTGRVGYTFIGYDGMGAISDNGFASFGMGLRWVPTAKTSFDVNGYRDFTPALVYANQNYFRNGVSFAMNQLLPYNWSFRTSVSLESADYFSTALIGNADRQDDYWRVGGDLSHPLSLPAWLNGQISAFIYYNSNDSSVGVANFDQLFTGMKVGLSY